MSASWVGVGSPQGVAAPQLRFIPWNALGQPLLGRPGRVRLCRPRHPPPAQQPLPPALNSDAQGGGGRHR